MKKIVGSFVVLFFSLMVGQLYADPHSWYQAYMMKQDALSKKNLAISAKLWRDSEYNNLVNVWIANHNDFIYSYDSSYGSCTAEGHPSCGGHHNCCVEDYATITNAASNGNSKKNDGDSKSQTAENDFQYGEADLVSGDFDLYTDTSAAFHHYLDACARFTWAKGDSTSGWDGAKADYAAGIMCYGEAAEHYTFFCQRHPFPL